MKARPGQRSHTTPGAPPDRKTRPATAVVATGILALSLVGAVHSPAAGAAATDDPPLVLHYDFDGDLSAGVVTDASPSSLDGSLVNPGSVAVVTGPDGSKALSLPGGAYDSTTAPYVQIPGGLFKDVRQATISTWVDWRGGPDWQWVYSLGKNDASAASFTPSYATDGKSRSAVKPVNGDSEVGVSGTGKLPTGQWVNVVTVLDGQTISYYLNGLLVGSQSATIDLAAKFDSDGISGFLGRPFWGGHPFLDGAIDDFRVYAGAMDAGQVAALAGPGLATPTGLSATEFPVTTTVDTAPALPSTVAGTYSDGIDRDVAVTWDAVDPAQYHVIGSFTVRGRAGGIDVTAQVTVDQADQVTVDLGSDTGAFMGGASGTLYGLYGPGIPSNNLIDGIKLRTVSTKAQDGPQHPGADALEVLKPLVDSSQGDVYVYMTDIYRGFPYQWPGDTPEERIADFKSKISKQVDQVLTLEKKYQDHVVFVPFNEPEGNMFGEWLSQPSAFFQAWDDVHALIKGKMPDARIAGPNTSTLFDQNKDFLRHTVGAGTVPDVFTWHELNAPASIRYNVDKYRGWEDEVFAGTAYAGRHLPININEYAYNYHTSVPGQMIQWVSALEDAKVDGDIAYWNIDGNLSDSAVQANRGNGQWWLLNAYGQMTGHTVTVTPPRPNESYTLQGVATVDPEKRQVQTLIGGSSGNADLHFTNADPALLGDTAHVVIRKIGWSGQVGDSAAPSLVKEFDVPLADGGATISFGVDGLPQLDSESAYQILLTPGANASSETPDPRLFKATYEAENADHSGAGWSKNGPEGSPANPAGFYTSGGYSVGGIRTGSDVKLNFSVDVPQDGKYDLSVFAGSLNTDPANAAQGPINAFVTVDGGAEQEIYLPLAYKWDVWDHADTTVDLTAGAHTITLSAKSLDGSRGTQGDALVDKIDLSLPNPAAAATTYEAEYATLGGGATTDYSQAGVSGSGAVALHTGGTATFWAYSQTDGESTLHLDASGSGSATVTVNGQDITTVDGSAVLPVFLSGGINKVTVTGLTGDLVVDRLQVAAGTGALTSTVVEAETGALTGSSVVTPMPLASGGEAVTGVGGDPGNDNTLSLKVSADQPGTYALTVRYSNQEQSPATHYNPDPLARHADLTVNGGAEQRLWFPHTFHKDNFWELTFPVQLQAGENELTFRSEELPNFDGVTYASDQYTELLRSQYAPNIDRITVTPFSGSMPATSPGAPQAVTATAGDGSATVTWNPPSSDGGSAVTGYVVTSSPEGKSCTTTGETSCGVAGLTNGQPYTFTVVATNAIGTSPNSGSSLAVIPGAAAPVVDVEVVSAGPATADGWYNQDVMVKLSAPADTGTMVQRRTNGGNWRTSDSALAVSSSGTTTIDYRLIAANQVVEGSAGSTTIKLDKVLPKANVLRTTATGRGTPRNPIDFLITGADALSGVASVEYRINQGDWMPVASDGSVRLDQPGSYVLTARTTDKAGNVSSIRSMAAVVNPDVPTVLRPWSPSVAVGSPITFNLAGFHRYDDVTLSASDGTVWGTVRTDVNGSARITLNAPAGATSGPINAVGADPAVTASASVRIR